METVYKTRESSDGSLWMMLMMNELRSTGKPKVQGKYLVTRNGTIVSDVLFLVFHCRACRCIVYKGCGCCHTEYVCFLKEAASLSAIDGSDNRTVEQNTSDIRKEPLPCAVMKGVGYQMAVCD